MTIPCYVNEYLSDIGAIKPGWYGMESNGKLSSGPYPNQGKCLTGITGAIFAHRPGCGGPLSPECGGEHVRPCTRVDGYGVR